MMYRIKNVRGSTIAKTHNVSPHLPLIPIHNNHAVPTVNTPFSQKLPKNIQPKVPVATVSKTNKQTTTHLINTDKNIMTNVLNKKSVASPIINVKDNKSAIMNAAPRLNASRNGIRPASKGIKVNTTVHKNIVRPANTKVQFIENKEVKQQKVSMGQLQSNKQIEQKKEEKVVDIKVTKAKKEHINQHKQKQSINTVIQQTKQKDQSLIKPTHQNQSNHKELKDKSQIDKQENHKPQANGLKINENHEGPHTEPVSHISRDQNQHGPHQNITILRHHDRNHDHHHQIHHNDNKHHQNQAQSQSHSQPQHQHRQNANPIAGMLHTSDPLSHFQFSDLIMDLQIKNILKTSFVNLPNGRQIQYKKQQLQRINTSYVLAKQANSTLKDGLNGYRIQLFNQIGELIMQNMQNRGNAGTVNRVNDFAIIEASHHNNLVQQATLMRGIPKDKMSKVIKKINGRHGAGEQQIVCSICLDGIQNGGQHYGLQCGHSFHPECCQEWVQISGNCPTCRKNLKL